MATSNFYRLIHAEDVAPCFMANEEGYLIRPNGKAAALLAEDLPFQPEDGAAVMLIHNAQAAGVAGVARVPLNGDILLGGWCSFGCKLAVPRKFAARAGAELVGGAEGQDLLVQCVRDTLREVFQAAVQEESPPVLPLQASLNELLQPALRQRLISLGWQLTHCRLENILMTRSV